MNKSTTAKTTKFNFQTIIQKPRNFNPSKFSTLTVLKIDIKLYIISSFVYETNNSQSAHQ